MKVLVFDGLASASFYFALLNFMATDEQDRVVQLFWIGNGIVALLLGGKIKKAGSKFPRSLTTAVGGHQQQPLDRHSYASPSKVAIVLSSCASEKNDKTYFVSGTVNT